MTALPTAPKRGIDTQTVFVTKAEALFDALTPFVTEGNALEANVNAKETSATNSATSATNSATSAANSATSATNSATSATNSASTATTQATSATNSANAAALSYDSFDDRYLGVKTTNPALDNDGAVLLVGALYFNSTTSQMRVWNGTLWSDSLTLTEASISTLSNKTINLTSNTLVATSAQILAAITDETGTGSIVFNTSPVLVTPSIGVATGTSFNSITGLATIVSPMDGVAAIGTSVTAARQDHIHESDALRVPRDSITGSASLPAGTTAQRTAAPTAGNIRFNTELVKAEVHTGTAWTPVGAGATGGGTDAVFLNGSYTVTTSYTLPTGLSTIALGDANGNLTINDGVVITIPNNSRMVVL